MNENLKREVEKAVGRALADVADEDLVVALSVIVSSDHPGIVTAAMGSLPLRVQDLIHTGAAGCLVQEMERRRELVAGDEVAAAEEEACPDDSG